jgi:hypothetical protein
MHRILHAPFTSPDVLTVAERLDAAPEAPLLVWFHMIAGSLGEKGVHATTTANLPRELTLQTNYHDAKSVRKACSSSLHAMSILRPFSALAALGSPSVPVSDRRSNATYRFARPSANRSVER